MGGYSAKEAALLLLQKAIKLNPKWSATIDGDKVLVNRFEIVAGPIAKFEVDLIDSDNPPFTLTAEHPLISLGADDGDDIVVNGADVDNDDVDIIVKLGFPRTAIKFQFEYGDTVKQHTVVVSTKVNLIAFILA